ncbi:MAG: hypothetical protein ACYS9X_31935, partial [Planctomycetota bacterium]
RDPDAGSATAVLPGLENADGPAETQCMCVALASMVSKYVRELFVRRLNRWFGERVEDLKPTAGYPVDAARFLADTAEFRARAGIAEFDLVRSR